MYEATKPPIGAKPLWLVVEERLGDLSHAILNELESDNVDINSIRQYVYEMESFLEIGFRFED